MTHYHTIILLGALAVLAFLWDMLSRRTRIPTVIFLLLTGMALRIAATHFDLPVPPFEGALQVIGSIGLVFIVFEGAMDLELTRERKGLILQAFISALSILVLTAWAIATIYHNLVEVSWHRAWVNALPLAIISSSVAIPSSRSLDSHRREFVVYESTFSDILGILLFNFILAHSVLDAASFTGLGWDIIWVTALSAVATASLLYLVAKTEAASKFTLLFALLVLAYAVGKLAHLPTLLLIFALGICLNNARLLPLPLVNTSSAARRLRQELRILKRLTGEGSFLLRTYFFVLFGFSMRLVSLGEARTLGIGLLILATLLGVRAAFLFLLLRRVPLPEALMAPRGLITVLLFYSIPEGIVMPVVGQDVILVVILGSTLLMAIGLQINKKQQDKLAITPRTVLEPVSQVES